LNVRLVLVVFLLGVLALLPASASAITGGQYDANGHPYVAYVSNGVTACSGTLLSPTVMLTAAHCFTGAPLGTNASTGAPLVAASFDPDLALLPSAQRTWHIGTYYADPQFAFGSAGGVPGFATHDVAIVIFTSTGCVLPAKPAGTCGPIATSATGGLYGALPSPGLVDTLKMKAPVDLVGYGVQGFVVGGGQPAFGASGTRFAAATTLIASNDTLSDAFVKLHANKGGSCFGDSGGPNLLGGTNTVLAVNSFVTNDMCAGETYSYRVDTPEALAFITGTAAARGGSF
jgi:hypothetical protein